MYQNVLNETANTARGLELNVIVYNLCTIKYCIHHKYDTVQFWTRLSSLGRLTTVFMVGLKHSLHKWLGLGTPTWKNRQAEPLPLFCLATLLINEQDWKYSV